MVIVKYSALSGRFTTCPRAQHIERAFIYHRRKLMDNYPLKPRLIYAHDTYPRTSIVPTGSLKIFQYASAHSLAGTHVDLSAIARARAHNTHLSITVPDRWRPVDLTCWNLILRSSLGWNSGPAPSILPTFFFCDIIGILHWVKTWMRMYIVHQNCLESR